MGTRGVTKSAFTSLALIITLLLCLPSIVIAVENDNSDQTKNETNKNPISNELEESLVSGIAKFESHTKYVVRMEKKLEQSEGIQKVIVAMRLDRARSEAIDIAIQLASDVDKSLDDNINVERYIKMIGAILSSSATLTTSSISSASQRLKLVVSDVKAASYAEENANLLHTWKLLEKLYRNSVVAQKLFDRLNVEGKESPDKLISAFTEGADNISVFLDLTLQSVEIVKMQINALPEDAELKAMNAVIEARVTIVANMLRDYIDLMSMLEIDVNEYEQQLVYATGQLTTDVLNYETIAALFLEWGGSIVESVVETGPAILFDVILFFIILYIAKKLAMLVTAVMDRGIKTSKLQVSQLLEKMLVSSIYNLIIFLGVLIGLAQLGISLGPVLAGLGIFGFIVGFALQDSLSNLASGMLILVYRPFDVGDLIDTESGIGTVSHMTLVNTTIKTLDNQTLIIPNNLIWQGIIKNMTAQKVRRVDLVFGISYSDDVVKTEEVLAEIVQSCDMVLSKPAPVIKLHELDTSSVNFIVRPWVRTDDYWDVYWFITRAVKMRFDEERITIPFPQSDVHLDQHAQIVFER